MPTRGHAGGERESFRRVWGKPDLSLGGQGKLLCIEAGRTGEEPKSHVMSGIPPTEPQVLLGDFEKRSDPLWASSPPLQDEGMNSS